MQISSKSSASGKCALDRGLAPLDLVLQVEIRAQHAEIGGADADAELDQGRLIELDDDENVKQRQQQHGDRHHHAEEQISDIGRVTAIAGLHQQRARRLLADPFREIEVLDNGVHVRFRRLPQRYLVALRHSLALALPDLLALERHGFHARRQRIARQQRHRQRQHRSARRDRREQHGEKLRVDELLERAQHDPS